MFTQLMAIDQDLDNLLKAEAMGHVTAEEYRIQLDWLFLRMVRVLEAEEKIHQRPKVETPERVTLRTAPLRWAWASLASVLRT